jgi:hypothetical protein
VTAAAELPSPAQLRAELRVASIASGLLLLLDERRISGRLPSDVRNQLGRLRHAVKLTIQGATGSAAPPPPPSCPPASLDAGDALQAWIAAQPWAKPGPHGWVYLLCFRDPATGEHRPYRGEGCRGQYAGHYWAPTNSRLLQHWTTDLVRRINREHHNPNWNGAGRLVQVALAAELTFALAYVEYPATLGRERRLKNQGSAYRRCPLCRGTGGPLDPAAAVAAVLEVGGAR